MFAAASFVLGLCCGVPPPASHAHNVLLIIADDLGTSKVGIYGESANAPPTPTLDMLAANGIFFRHAWALPSCSPTRAAILTGRYGFRTGVGRNVFNHNVLQLDELILPEVVSSVGYSSAMIGKWHLGNENNGGDLGPNLAGWDHFSGSFLAAVPNYYSWPKLVDGLTGRVDAYATTENVDDALSWIGQQVGPWLCTVTFNAPHEPFHEPPAHLHTFDLGDLDPSQDPLPFYHAMIQAMDREIWRLLTGLDRMEELDDTAVIFIGDNGVDDLVAEFPCLPGRVKGTPFECGIRVPLIISGPHLVQEPGREILDPVSVTDIFATIADITGAQLSELIPAGTVVDSVSLLPYVDNTTQQPLRQTVYTERSNIDRSWIAAIRNDRYKLIRFVNRPDPDHLYDLAHDPFELVNLLENQELTLEEQLNYEMLDQEMIALHASQPR